MTLSGSPKDFNLFATSGFDGNWYVGFNSMWIAALAVPDQGDFQRAFLGAKLGRMKTKKANAIPCDLFIGVASTPSWRSSESYYLASCEDLPLEGISETPLDGVGEGRWFWREVPIASLKFGADNFVGIWSPTPELVNSQTAPVIAAAKKEGAINAWLNRSVLGFPPLDAESSLETEISGFAPALAIKLAPRISTDTLRVDLVSFKEREDHFSWEVQAEGVNVERARTEVSLDGESWLDFGAPVFDPPFIFEVVRSQIESQVKKLLTKKRVVEQAFVRVSVWDEWGNKASTQNFVIYIPPK